MLCKQMQNVRFFYTCRDSLPASEIRKKIPDIVMPPEVRLTTAGCSLSPLHCQAGPRIPPGRQTAVIDFVLLIYLDESVQVSSCALQIEGPVQVARRSGPWT